MIVSQYTIPGMHIRDHLIDVPLDWFGASGGPTIKLFAREVVSPTRKDDDLPLLVFLQGGPGGKSPRPTSSSPGWLVEALKSFRVILPDQRGTGRSTPVEASTMAQFGTAEAAGDYLAHFRADSIVADFEHLRQTIFGGKRWHSLGQSYGGFLTLTYLSQAPEALLACYVTGGLASIHPSAEEVYRRTYPRVEAKTARYYKRYPGDVDQVGALADYLASNDVRLPDGDRLTVRRLQTIGIDFGMKPGFESVHWLMDEAFATPDRLSDHFLFEVMRLTSYDSGPLFMVLQESIYGAGPGATAWAAERHRQTLPQFDPAQRPLLFTGEMMFPWMLDEIRSLRPFKAGAEALAARTHYSPLYDPTRLAANQVPVAALIYHDDMYVDADLSLQTARTVGNVHHWVTNEFEHDGLRQDAGVFRRLKTMVDEQGGPLAD
ncbi:MAG: alpha/beta fold hydrolase [Cypionkella sp.]